MLKHYLQKITTVAMCDALLDEALRNRKTLARRRRNAGEQIADLVARLDAIAAGLTLVLTQLQILTNGYASLSAGDHRVRLGWLIEDLEIRKLQWQRRTRYANAAMLLEKQFLYNRLDARLSAADSYVTALQERRRELEAEMTADVAVVPAVVMQCEDKGPEVVLVNEANPAFAMTLLSDNRRPDAATKVSAGLRPENTGSEQIHRPVRRPSGLPRRFTDRSSGQFLWQRMRRPARHHVSHTLDHANNGCSSGAGAAGNADSAARLPVAGRAAPAGKPAMVRKLMPPLSTLRS